MTALRPGPRGLSVVAALLSGVLALSACGGGDGDDGSNPGESSEGAPSPNVSVAEISISPENAAQNVGILSDVEVAVEQGTLDEVTMIATATGAEVSGTLSGDQTTWRPDAELERATEYEVIARASDSEGRRAHETVTFTTVSPSNSFIGYFTPEDGQTVGVGMPVSLNFDKSISNQAEIEEAVEITTSSGQEVVGHWFSDTRLDFRPEEYWEPYSEVTVELNWDGVEGAPDIIGVQDRTYSFEIGRSQISTADAGTHQMEVVRDGETLRTLPITAGAPENPTYNGQMVISEKHEETRMDGATVGFTDDDGEGEYDIPDVPHAMRLSTSGTFVHGNYWGGSAFGNANTSHGCIGLADVQGADDPDTDGAWFYENSLIGDVVIVENSPDVQMQPDNGLNGWNMDWDDWVAGSALN